MTFQKELEALINRHSMDNECNTPDFLLAEYLVACLAAYKGLKSANDHWHGVSATKSITG